MSENPFSNILTYLYANPVPESGARIRWLKEVYWLGAKLLKIKI
jgi:hypothetical protein